MSGCDVDRLEALAAGLDDRAEETRAHVAACARCAGELGQLRAERRLFATRAAAPAAMPPPFSAVLASVRRERRSWLGSLRGHARWVGLAAAAAVAAVFVARREPAMPVAVAEPLPSFACYDDPRSLAMEATAYATDRAVASAEDDYSACLVATPRATPAWRDPDTTGYAAACAPKSPVDTEVTCGGLRPLDDEVFESRIRGGSLQ